MILQKGIVSKWLLSWKEKILSHSHRKLDTFFVAQNKWNKIRVEYVEIMPWALHEKRLKFNALPSHNLHQLWYKFSKLFKCTKEVKCCQRISSQIFLIHVKSAKLKSPNSFQRKIPRINKNAAARTLACNNLPSC